MVEEKQWVAPALDSSTTARGRVLKVVETIFGKGIAENHAGRIGDELLQPARRVINEYDPQERGLGS